MKFCIHLVRFFFRLELDAVVMQSFSMLSVSGISGTQLLFVVGWSLWLWLSISESEYKLMMLTELDLLEGVWFESSIIGGIVSISIVSSCSCSDWMVFAFSFVSVLIVAGFCSTTGLVKVLEASMCQHDCVNCASDSRHDQSYQLQKNNSENQNKRIYLKSLNYDRYRTQWFSVSVCGLDFQLFSFSFFVSVLLLLWWLVVYRCQLKQQQLQLQLLSFWFLEIVVEWARYCRCWK